MLWEAMIRELRAVRLDLAARAPFTEDGKQVIETRRMVDAWVHPEAAPLSEEAQRSAASLTNASHSGFVEVG